MKAIYYTATSLDGYIADEHHSLDWLFQFGDGDESSYPEFIKDVGAIAMGSHTYEWVLDNYVFTEPDAPKPWPHEQPIWVFTSRELRKVEGDVRFVRGDVAPVYEEMRQVGGGKNVWVAGGGGLAAQFHEAGLLDELILTLAPVFVGGGARLFEGSLIKPPMQVLHVKSHSSGLTELRLEVTRT